MTRALRGMKVAAPCTLTGMALDAAAVLDAAGAQRAHVVGVSMGGMIAQVLAALQPQRVLSLTSVMSSSGKWARSSPPATVACCCGAWSHRRW